MNWLRCAFAGAAVVMLGWVLTRNQRMLAHARGERDLAARASSSRIGQEAEDQAIARAHSEVASGEYDMQG